MSILIQHKLGRCIGNGKSDLILDFLELEWHETTKRILHKLTRLGTSVTLRFLDQNPDLHPGDILYEDSARRIIVEIIPCRAIVLNPGSLEEASALCYEIGNRHLPLFMDGNQLLVPFETPFFHLLESAGYCPQVQERKLHHALKTSVSPQVRLALG